MTIRVSDAQQAEIQRLAGKGLGMADFDRSEARWCHMPFSYQRRIYDALERKGLVIYRSVSETGISLNGYRLTDEGRKLVKV